MLGSLLTVLLLTACMRAIYSQEEQHTLRLVGGDDQYSGELQVLVNGTYGGFCASGFYTSEAKVVCRALGFRTVEQFYAINSTDTPLAVDYFYCYGFDANRFNISSCYWNFHSDNETYHYCPGNDTVGLVCSDDYAIRLVQTNSSQKHYEGRLEIYHSGQWGTVCYNYQWSLANSRVVCKELGYPDARSLLQSYSPGSTDQPIWLEDVYCSGTEGSLLDCYYYGDWGDSYCTHATDVGLSCLDRNETLPVYPVRLVGQDGNTSTGRWTGRVEILYNNTWGNVCDDGWGIEDANVVCRQLGFDGALSALSYGAYGKGNITIWIDDVSCQGSEDALSQCLHRGWGIHDCSHSEDASVICDNPNITLTEPAVRLVNETGNVSTLSGRVEVFYGGEWGTVCGHSWDLADANVVCRQLGNSHALQALTYSHGNRGFGPVWMENVGCNGTEQYLSDCDFPGWGVAHCSHYSDAGAMCANITLPPRVRLQGGASTSEGRVEIYHNNQWGTVCSVGWDATDATIVCQQLGFVGNVEATTDLQFGPGEAGSPVWLSNVQCHGNEQYLADCMGNSWQENNCLHSQDAGVICTESNYTVPVRLVNGTDDLEGRVEVFYGGVWGTICDRYFTTRDGSVICRQLGFYSAIEAYSYDYFGPGSDATPILSSYVYCSGSEAEFGDCRGVGSSYTTCEHSQDVGVQCLESLPDLSGAVLRLVNGSGPFEGRVEVHVNGQWGTVCDDYWGNKDASVVCRQLGFAAEGAQGLKFAAFGRGRGAIVLDNVRCNGTEASIADCDHNDVFNHNCYHGEDAGVICLVEPDVDIRLRLDGRNASNEGRVEVFYDGQWGTICDNSWGYPEALVVCRMLHFANAVQAYSGGYFGPANDSVTVFLDAVDCDGRETSIVNCYHSNWTMNTCNHSHDAGVACTNYVQDEYPLRLGDSPAPGQGRLEVFYNGVWGTVCADGFAEREATVACRELGYRQGKYAEFRPATPGVSVWMEGVQCDGGEQVLSDCPFDGWGEHQCADHNDAGVVCANPVLPVRLVDGDANGTSGRVEVFYNHTWGSVCDDYWDIQDANVVCRQLGFTFAEQAHSNAHFGRSNGSIWLDDVACRGTEESLYQCGNGGLGIHDCSHYEDAGVVCSNATVTTSEGKIRLVGGRNSSEGRVEIQHNGVWGTVCDDYWDLSDAEVVCRQLNYDGALEAVQYSGFGVGTGPIWVDDIRCYGTERYLTECPFRGWNNSNCVHREDAGVRCRASSDYIRLVDGNSGSEGRVEVYHDGRWGTICDDGWDINDATVVCHQLGYPRALKAVEFGTFGEADPYSKIWMTKVGCEGTEDTLFSCDYEGWVVDNCQHSEDASVICSEVAADEHPIRLVGGDSRMEGRVEIYTRGQWGTVCDDTWNMTDANVVCRSQGFPGALSAPTSSQFGGGQGPVALSGVNCVGTEPFLSLCPATTPVPSKCTHATDASVTCMAESWDIRLMNGSVANEGRVEVKYQGVWGTICDDLWSIDAANVACRMLGYVGATQAWTEAHFGGGVGQIWLDDVYCLGSETSLYECGHSGWRVHNCKHSEDAGVTCSTECPSVSIANGNVTMVGPTATITCNSGYHLDGASQLVCHNMKWDQPLPTCKLSTGTPSSGTPSKAPVTQDGGSKSHLPVIIGGVVGGVCVLVLVVVIVSVVAWKCGKKMANNKLYSTVSMASGDEQVRFDDDAEGPLYSDDHDDMPLDLNS